MNLRDLEARPPPSFFWGAWAANLNTPKTGELKPNRHHYRDGCQNFKP
uniref:Uncharacterized protein n=1 Tax=Siphoviridae sp. ctMBu2 TaxID=2827853 RepID=A0A8S5T4P9_9CAUD|nr:MAG TPA: hypothetical protein [Siphoviridae sp. ctMBu2]